MAQDQPIYPKKLGILILFSSAMDLTIKFGALPIYVLAPINTAPAEIASSMSWDTVPTEVAMPCVAPRAPAVWRKTRYVGVLSRKDDRAPVAQNICHGSDKPSSAPWVFRKIRAGIMVMKMPMNSFATSAMGA